MYYHEIGENNFGFAYSQQSRDKTGQAKHVKTVVKSGHQQQASCRDFSKSKLDPFINEPICIVYRIVQVTDRVVNFVIMFEYVIIYVLLL